MQNTLIGWTDHTLNFWWGCTKVSPACTHCYAETVAKVFGKRLFGQVPQWGAGKPRFERLHAARKEALALNRKAAKKAVRERVFVNSMSDWLDADVPLAWLDFLLETIHLCPHLDFQLLTKRPENWEKRLNDVNDMEGPSDNHLAYNWQVVQKAPPNIWLGVTAENQELADQRIPHLLKIPAKVRFLSCEPLVGPIDFTPAAPGKRAWLRNPLYGADSPTEPVIHWIIAGGESGGQASPSHPDWFRSLRDQCAAAAVPFFFKQWGEWLPQGETTPEPLGHRAYKGQKLTDDTLMLRVGTALAGNLLDGCKHEAFPAPETQKQETRN